MTQRTIAVPAPRPAPAGRKPDARNRTTTVVYDSAHLRVRVRDGEVLWFVRDIARALGFRPPLTPGAAGPQVLLTTAELGSVMAAAGFRPPAAFTGWAAELALRLPCPESVPSPRG
ncbi:BRO-N domain-containing protein [Streptomyces tendae]|uniref:hypothetical protein n=1 Tax=Streptomyces tendae TaxID=1932 RepID=UPI0036A7216C